MSRRTRPFEKLEFDEDGATHGDLPWSVQARAYRLAKDTEYETEEAFADGPATGRNDEADAYRHALWSYRMTVELGTDIAKTVGDAHERTRPNSDEELLLDLFENRIGRLLANDPANAGRPAEAVVPEALEEGLLRTRPFFSYRGAPSGSE